MSMIGKLRQVSEFDLAKYKKNPGEMVRALAGASVNEAAWTPATSPGPSDAATSAQSSSPSRIVSGIGQTCAGA